VREESGGGWAAPLRNLYMSRVQWYDNTYKLFNPIKKGLLLTAIQIRGTAETRRCVADAVRLQVITLNAFLTLRASYLPLPPPSSSPCSRTCPLSRSSLIQHMVYRGVSTQLPLAKIIGISILQQILFCSSFSLLLHTRTFFTIPLAEKMHPLFSADHQSEYPFPVFFFVTIFTLL
jgi:hypothetical protein